MRHLLITTVLAAGFAGAVLAAEVNPADKLADTQTFSLWLLDAVATLDPQLVETSDDIVSVVR